MGVLRQVSPEDSLLILVFFLILNVLSSPRFTGTLSTVSSEGS